jgi:AraC-like DNA-binding protein
VDLGPSRIVVIPPETPFAAHSRNAAGHLYIHFVAGAPFVGASPALLQSPLDEVVSGIVKELVALAAAGREAGARGVLLSWLLAYHGLRIVPSEQWRESSADPRVARAQRSMELQVEHPLPNTALAKDVGMNTNAFIRLFHGQTGESPQAWYARRRIDYACDLLHHTRKSIDQIADETGFCDRAHFSRVFTRQRGVGPAQFRRQIAG